MPELRQDPTTKEWVVIAAERAKRPDQFRESTEAISATAARNDACPFCRGNEHLTPAEVYAVRDMGASDKSGWRVRVIPNKFAAFLPKDRDKPRGPVVFFNSQEGFGYHEVIIETPHHDRSMPLMREGEIDEVLKAYCERCSALRKDSRVKLVLIFRNHGHHAGTSLEHPHSQLVGTPIIPFHIRQKYEIAIQHYDDTGRCLYCDVVDHEKQDGRRVIFETPRFLVFHPFASRVPFETWIAPKHHNPCFAHMRGEERLELAVVLHRVLRGLYEALQNPDFNLIIHTAPIEDENKPYFLWHIEVWPRLTTRAGFELGTGIYINTEVPEQTAEFMRDEIKRGAK